MHRACVDVLGRPDLDLVIPAMVVAEAAYLVERRLGPVAETAFIRGLSGFAIESPAAEDWPSIADVVERYADLRLGTTDASIAVLADRLGTDVVVTLDRRHFDVIRTRIGWRVPCPATDPRMRVVATSIGQAAGRRRLGSSP